MHEAIRESRNKSVVVEHKTIFDKIRAWMRK